MNAASHHPDAHCGHAVETVLVVDDDVLIRIAIAGYLRGCGYKVLEADGAREAITLFEPDIPIDLVFSDVQMPGEMDGFGLARWVRSHRPGVRVILTSGALNATTAAAELCGHDAFLQKPYQEQQVSDRISNLLTTRTTCGRKDD